MVDLFKTKRLSSALTSYDLLKTLALLLMVVDHIGYFFYPEEMWWRVIGRLSVPIWFFLIGYAKTREVPKLFWFAGALVALSSLAGGEYLFPLNIVFTLIFARLAVDWTFSHGLRNREAFAGMFFLFFLLGLPTLVFIEYGTLGLLFTFIGAMRRDKDMVTAPVWMIAGFMLASAGAFILMQGFLLPSLNAAQLLVFVLGMVALLVIFYGFRPIRFERLNLKTFLPVALLQFTGRRTLEIYVVHLLILRAVVVFTNPERFSLFEFKVFAFAFVEAFLFGV